MFSWLFENVPIANSKFERFIEIVQTANTKDYANTTLNDDFLKNR
jgi:hypothetical protein